MRLTAVASITTTVVLLVWFGVLLSGYFSRRPSEILLAESPAIPRRDDGHSLQTEEIQVKLEGNRQSPQEIANKNTARSSDSIATPPLSNTNEPSRSASSSLAPVRHFRTKPPLLTKIAPFEANGSLPRSFTWIEEFTRDLPYRVSITHYDGFFIVDPPNSTVVVVSMVALVQNAKSSFMRMLVGPSTQNKFRYALGCHQYSLAVIHKSLYVNRAPNWSKVRGLSEIMKIGNARYEWLFWIDADAVFTNFKITLESFMQDPRADLYFTHDHNGFHSGIFLIRNSDWSRALLDEAWVIEELNPKAFKNGLYYDQDALDYVIRHTNDTTKYVQLPKRRMNSYDGRTDSRNDYERGDFIVHQPACKRWKSHKECALDLEQRAAEAIPCE